MERSCSCFAVQPTLSRGRSPSADGSVSMIMSERGQQQRNSHWHLSRVHHTSLGQMILPPSTRPPTPPGPPARRPSTPAPLWLRRLREIRRINEAIADDQAFEPPPLTAVTMVMPRREQFFCTSATFGRNHVTQSKQTSRRRAQVSQHSSHSNVNFSCITSPCCATYLEQLCCGANDERELQQKH